MSISVDVNIYCITYNHSKYIRQALDGFLMQKTTFSWNIILFDDASTDGNQEIIREYIDKYPEKFIAILSEENYYSQGKSRLPDILPYFTGKYIATCEGDDYWIDPYKLQKQYDIMEQNPQYSACYHNFIPVDKNNNRHSNYKCYSYLKTHIYDKNKISQLQLPGQTATKFMRNIYTEVSPEIIYHYNNCKMNGDLKMALLLTQLGEIFYLEDEMAAHRMVWDEGESYTAKVHRGEINTYIQQYNSYTEMQTMLKNAFNKEYNPFTYKCDLLISLLYQACVSRSRHSVKTFFTLLIQKDYPLLQKLVYIFSKFVKHISSNVLKFLHLKK